jgi:hypothetical protein
MDKSEVLKLVCEKLPENKTDECKDLVNTYYPFQSYQVQKRIYTPSQMLKVFRRDGFIDRYSGQKLLFPGIFRIFKNKLPEVFPAHSNWKMTETHIVYWEMFPTIDHFFPIARGGRDDDSNWITTSMVRNSAKANWTIEELGWKLHQPGSLKDWDGLSEMFKRLVEQERRLLEDKYIGNWYKALSLINR